MQGVLWGSAVTLSAMADCISVMTGEPVIAACDDRPREPRRAETEEE
jgi:hypothetical protein